MFFSLRHLRRFSCKLFCSCGDVLWLGAVVRSLLRGTSLLCGFHGKWPLMMALLLGLLTPSSGICHTSVWRVSSRFLPRPRVSCLRSVVGCVSGVPILVFWAVMGVSSAVFFGPTGSSHVGACHFGFAAVVQLVVLGSAAIRSHLCV